MTEEEYINLAGKYFNENDPLSAQKTLKKTIKKYPGSATAYYNLGVIQAQQNDLKAAVNSYIQAVSLNPDFELANLNLGVTYIRMGYLDDAIRVFEKFVDINTESFQAYFNLGLVLIKKNEYYKATEKFNKSIELNATYSPALFHMATTLFTLGKMESSIHYLTKYLAIEPKSIEALCYLGFAHQFIGSLSEAKEFFEKALTYGANPSMVAEGLYAISRKICDWNGVDKYGKLLSNLTQKGLKDRVTQIEPPYINIERTDNLKSNLDVARYWSNLMSQDVANSGSTFSFKKNKINKGKIKVGYLSPDFRAHPVSLQVIDLFKYHDRDKFEIFAYSYGKNDGSELRKKIEKESQHFIDLADWNHKKIAQKIYSDKIDILVDLAGYTGFQRPDITAYKPAPIQFCYLGYPATTGASYIDYTLADEVVIPESEKKYYSENLIYMPNCFQICSQPEIKNIKYKRSDFDLPEKEIVFCSFNRAEKIEKKVFDVWINILKRVPNGVLWLTNHHPLAMKNLTDYFIKSGLESNRLIFAKRLPTVNEHLNRIKLVDMALDTLTYNGGATSTNALWMGVPVITLHGKHFASRVSSSFLTNVGLTQLITKNLKEYEDLAVDLALNPQKLFTTQKSLALNRKSYPLFNSQLFIKNLEKAYIKVWKNYLQGKKSDVII